MYLQPVDGEDIEQIIENKKFLFKGGDSTKHEHCA